MTKLSYQVCHHLLHVLGAFFHLILGPSELNNVALVCRVWEVDDNLQEAITSGQDHVKFNVIISEALIFEEPSPQECFKNSQQGPRMPCTFANSLHT